MHALLELLLGGDELGTEAPPPPFTPPGPTVTLPAGIVPVRTLTRDEILTGNRATSFRYDLLTKDEAPKGTLDGVDQDRPGSLEFVASASVKGSGLINVVDNGQPVDWLNDRIRPVIIIDGLDPEPMGVFIIAKAPADLAGTGRTRQVKLLDKTAILDQDQIDATFGLLANSIATDAIVDLLESSGEANFAITPSSGRLRSALFWDPGTSKLAIINDLLDMLNYFSLHCDAAGQFRAEPYTRPAARPITWEFVDGENCIYLPEFEIDVDLWSIPNEVLLTSQGGPDAASLFSTATNDDPLSPYSTVSRGRTITYSEKDVEAADQSTLDGMARRKLIEKTTPTQAVTIKHAYVPGLTVNRAVRFRSAAAGIDARHVVSKTSPPLSPTGLVTTTLTLVVDV